MRLYPGLETCPTFSCDGENDLHHCQTEQTEEWGEGGREIHDIVCMTDKVSIHCIRLYCVVIALCVYTRSESLSLTELE